MTNEKTNNSDHGDASDRMQTAMQRIGFEKAQDARRSMVLTPLQRNQEKIMQALAWCHGWQQSTAMLLMLACKSNSSAFLTKMREDGLLRIERLLGQNFWLCTKTGVDLLRLKRGPHDPLAQLSGTRHTNLFAFDHNMYAQRVLCEKLKSGPALNEVQWFCDRQLRAILENSESGAKVPDALYISKHEHTFIEVERSPKKQPALEVMLLNIARILEKHQRAQCEIYIDAGIAGRYQSTLGGWLARHEFRAWSLSTSEELFESGIYATTAMLDDALKRIKFIPSRVRA